MEKIYLASTEQIIKNDLKIQEEIMIYKKLTRFLKKTVDISYNQALKIADARIEANKNKNK